MPQTEKIIQAITDFVQGGDTRDAALLDKVLHNDFRVASNGFMGAGGVTIIDKQQYLTNIREGIFGGVPRQMNIELINQTGTLAMVKLSMSSEENLFLSYNSLVKEDDEWKLIHNLAEVTSRK